jgi:CRP-like cAMP-binding protein/CheY-like chemotaxis protein
MNNTILLIEDSDEMRESISEILKLANYTIVLAQNGKEGLEQAQKNPPALILCDINMPELDGFGVLRGLSNNPRTQGIPFIFVTGRSDKSDFRKGMDLGADDYLMKPFTGDELLSLVNTRLKKAQLLKEISGKIPDEFEKIINSSSSSTTLTNLVDKSLSKKVRKKDTIFLEGETANYLYYVVSGKVKTFRTNEQGKEYITQVCKEGDFFGYNALLEPGRHQETAMTLENSEVATIPKQNFYHLLFSNSELSVKFIQYITTNLSESGEKLVKLAYNSARKRVAEALNFLAGKYHPTKEDNVCFPASRDDISAISGISPESVSRNLTDFRAEKLIEIQNGIIKITNMKKLENLKN